MRNDDHVRYGQSVELPYTPDQMFDLVADVERYPEFLHEYRDVRIRSRSGNLLHVDQVIALPMINLTLSAIATLMRPDSIVVRSKQSLLGEMEINWKFEPIGLGVRVDFQMTLTPPSRFGAGIAEYLMSKSAERTLHAFADRAAELYLSRSISS